MNDKRVLIVGGGFGGIAAALSFAKFRLPGVKVTLVSDKNHFEYHAALYRVVTGKSPLEVCIPLREIFDGYDVEILRDKISTVNLKDGIAEGLSGSKYNFEYIILALGSETSYMNIPGLEKNSFGFKSIPEALRLKNHLHQLYEESTETSTKDADKVSLLHFVVVGAGASGVELAGELACYSKKMAISHEVSGSLVTIDLIEASPRVLPSFSEGVSRRAEARLRKLGINIFVNRPMEKGEIESIMVRGLSMKTETIIWTAGIKSNALYQQINGLEFDKKGRVLVDEYLRAKNFENSFAIGDGASTVYSGLAQTAIHEGKTAAQNIKNIIEKRRMARYRPQRPFHSIPIGPGWAATILSGINLYGYPGWVLRRAADFRYFASILPIRKALLAFMNGKTVCESCSICLPEEDQIKVGQKLKENNT